jgi:hypothetical protein
VTFRKFKKLGSAAGGADLPKTMKNNLMADEVSGFLYCSVSSALRSDWVAIVEVIYPDGSWNLPTSICLWSSTRTQARSRQVTAATCATQRPQPANPRTRDSLLTAPPHSLTRPQARITDDGLARPDLAVLRERLKKLQDFFHRRASFWVSQPGRVIRSAG